MDGWVNELVRRGVDRPYATQLAGLFEPSRIAAALQYFDALGHEKQPGLLVLAVREGRKPKASKESTAEERKAYGDEIVAWITEHLPDLCLPNPQLVSLTRDLYGDVVADSLAASRSPHPAAIAAVIRLHQTEGRRLSPRSHGQVIRRAVEASDRQAIAESEKLISERLEASA